MHSKTDVRELYRNMKKEFDAQIKISFLLQDWEDPYNVGGMFRVADACGARHLYLAGRTPAPPHPQVHVTSLGHHRRIAWSHYPQIEDGVAAARSNGCTMVAVELAHGAQPYMDFDWPDTYCLVLGNENLGVYDKVMRLMDSAVFIPQLGKGRSMNVHVSAAVVAFHSLFIGGLNQREP